MATFLTLPQELRDKILTLAIKAPLSPPQPPGPNEDHPSFLDNYTSFHDRINAIPTLLVNKQLHRETKAVIDRLPNKHSYDLDILVVNEEELWPTWLSVPALTSQVEKVRATFRWIGISNKSDQGQRGFQGGDRGPSIITWSFYDLLTRFILGLQEWQTHFAGKFLKHSMSIKLLELDFRSPDLPTELIAPDVDYRSLLHLREESGVDYLMNPAFLATFIEIHLRRLLSTRIATFGSLFYERIGTIKFYLDGELRKELDVGNLLVTMDLPYGESREWWREWRKNTYNSREQLGLPIVPLPEED
jgi:hypothetical protein